jgi:glycosyltransferase involved in cell wall biosynthesis
MPANIIIMLDKLKNLNCGLGKVAVDFSQALIKESNPDMRFTFLLNDKEKWDYLKEQQIKQLHFFNRLIPLSFPDDYIFHALHQLPSYRISGSCKKIITVHDLNFVHVKSKTKALRYLKKVQQNIYRSDAIVFVSNFTKNECFKYLDIPENKITSVIYNGVNLPDTKPEKPSFLNQNDNFLFSIGQFLVKKNFHVLIPFMQKIKEETKLVISGDNNTAYGNYMKKSVIGNKLEKRIILSGPVTDAEKLYLYLNCKAFLFPSIAEGFGLPVLEALRAGKPVFCSDKTSLMEIGNNYVFYWHSFDTNEMLKTFYSGLEAFSAEKKEAALKYSLQFTWKENVKQYLKLYKSLTTSV